MSSRNVFYFASAWLAFNWIQAAWLPLDPDEAYYLLYAARLDWGYFDHPPMTAFFIRAGQALFPGAFGARFFFPILQLVAFGLLRRLAGSPTDRAGLLFFFALLAAMPFFHVFGFIATPDSPLLFFTAAYLWALDGLLRHNNWKFALLLAAAMAGLLYSKYHGLLVIGFSLLPYWRKILELKWVSAGLIALALYMPHLNWQYRHDFISIRYHLLGGRDDLYELKYTLNYLLNQFLVFSPLLFPFIIRAVYHSVKAGTKGIEAACRWMIIGFWAFFLYSTGKGHVEPQWTAALTPAIVLILWNRYRPPNQGSALVRKMAVAGFVLLMIARIGLMLHLPGVKNPLEKWDWIAPVDSIAGNTPVVFQNSYRSPAQFTFQTGKKAYTLTDLYYRPSQFDLWGDERDLQNRSVWIIGQGDWRVRGAREIKPPLNTFRIKKVDSLQVARQVKLEFAIPDATYRPGDTLHLPVKLTNPYPFDIYPDRGDMPLSLWIIFDVPRDHGAIRMLEVQPERKTWPSGAGVELSATAVIPARMSGEYRVSMGIAMGDLPPGYNSSAAKIVIAH